MSVLDFVITAFGIVAVALFSVGAVEAARRWVLWVCRKPPKPEDVLSTEYTPVKHYYCPICGLATPVRDILSYLEFYKCQYGHEFSINRSDGTLYEARKSSY